MIWNAAASRAYPNAYASLTLPPTLQPNMAHTLDARFQLLQAPRDLVDRGELSPDVIAQQPTSPWFGAAIAWRALQENAVRCRDASTCLPHDGCP
jgi:hypothetical protein